MLSWIGFEVGASMAADSSRDPVVVEQQDGLADNMGPLALAVAAARLRRHLWMLRGWPSLALVLLELGQVGDEAIALFGTDLDLFRAAQAHSHVPGARAVARRSSFNHIAVQQLEAMLLATGSRVTAEVKAFSWKTSLAVSL